MPKPVTRNKQLNLRLPPDLRARMDQVRDDEGVPYAQQIMRGLQLYFESKGVKLAARKRGKDAA